MNKIIHVVSIPEKYDRKREFINSLKSKFPMNIYDFKFNSSNASHPRWESTESPEVLQYITGEGQERNKVLSDFGIRQFIEDFIHMG